jgi:hypothetical protein
MAGFGWIYNVASKPAWNKKSKPRNANQEIKIRLIFHLIGFMIIEFFTILKFFDVNSLFPN